MAVYKDAATGFILGADGFNPFSDTSVSQDLFFKEFNSMILSASGWRKVFVSSGNEEDAGMHIGSENAALAVYIAQSYVKYFLEKTGKKHPCVAVGIDSRPTGQEIAQILIQVLLTYGIQVRYLFITAAPEIMAYARNCDGFVYISASHNPVGHNGIKFGFNDGGVIPGSEAAKLSALFKTLCSGTSSAQEAQEIYVNSMKADIKTVFEASEKYKKEALSYYTSFTRAVISSSSDAAVQEGFSKRLSSSAKSQKITILADMNGSARTVSIDEEFLTDLSFGFVSFNDAPRSIAHAIIPEPENLVYCARKMEELHEQGDDSVLLGYMPDCDGDRGNIVYWNDKEKKAEVLKAQEVFALSVLSELSYTAYSRNAFSREEMKKLKTAVSVNDPTSMRIEDIAHAFSAEVHRAEVGEANVVNLARSLRDKGYSVPILGEGSNGGNITHPAAVRDPINTVFALLKLLTIKDDPAAGKKGLYHLWLDAEGKGDSYSENFTLTDILCSLPAWTTTGVSEQRAMLHIASKDHAQLKKAYQKVFSEQWKVKKEELNTKFGIASWRAISNNGIHQTNNLDDFSLSGSGGLKIVFSDSYGTDIAYIWMRGSGTEPVFRVICDVRGNTEGAISMEKELLEWHRSMIRAADVA